MKTMSIATRSFILSILSSAIILLFLNSCVTEKQRLRICKSCTLNQTIKDSVGTPEVKNQYYDSIIYWKIRAGKNIYVNNCDSLIFKLKANKGKIETDSNGVKGTIVSDGKKGFVFRCEADSLKSVIKLLRQRITTPTFRYITKEVPARCDLDHRTSFDGFCRWFTFIVCGLILVAVILKLTKAWSFLK